MQRIILFYDNLIRDFLGLLLLEKILKELGYKVYLLPLWDWATKKVDELKPDLAVMGQVSEYTTSTIGKYIKDKGIKIVLNSTESGGPSEQIKYSFLFNFKEPNDKYIDLQTLPSKVEAEVCKSVINPSYHEKYIEIGFPRYDICLTDYLRDCEKDVLIKKYQLNKYNRKFVYASSFIHDGSGEQVSEENKDDLPWELRELLDEKESEYTMPILFNLANYLEPLKDVLIIKRHPWEKGNIWKGLKDKHKNVIVLDDYENLAPILSSCDYLLHLRSTTAVEAWVQGNAKTISIYPDIPENKNMKWRHLQDEVIVSNYNDLTKVIENYPREHPGKNYLKKYYQPYLDGKATIRLAQAIHNLLKTENIRKHSFSKSERIAELIRKRPVKSKNLSLKKQLKGYLINVYDLLRSKEIADNQHEDTYEQKFIRLETRKKHLRKMYQEPINKYIKEHYNEILEIKKLAEIKNI